MDLVYEYINGHHNADPADNAESLGTFNNHNSEVWFCSIHPTMTIAASASRNGQVFIWDLMTKKVHFDKPGGSSTIAALEFSRGGDFFLVAYHPCSIEVFSFTKEEEEEESQAVVAKLREIVLEVEATWIRWHTLANTIYCGTTEGNIHYWKVPQLAKNTLGVGVPTSCEVADIAKDGTRLLVGHDNGLVRLWDLQNQTIEVDIPADEGLKEKIFKVSAQLNTSLYIATTYRKLMVFTVSMPLWVFDMPPNAVISSIASPVEGRSPLLAIGTTSNKFMIYNIMSKELVDGMAFDVQFGAVTVVKWLTKEILAIGTTMGDVLAINIRTRQKLFAIHGHSECIIDFQTLLNNQRIVTASADGSLNYFQCHIST